MPGLHFDDVKLWTAIHTVEYRSFKMTRWWEEFRDSVRYSGTRDISSISPDKARKGVIYPLKTGIYALVEISERTFTR